MESSFDEFTIINLVQAVRDILDQGHARSYEEKLLMLDRDEIWRFREAS